MLLPLQGDIISSILTQGVASLCPGLSAFAPCLSFQPATFGSGHAKEVIHNQTEPSET